MEETVDLFQKVKSWLDVTGVNFSVGTGFSLLKMKATPYLKIGIGKDFDIGPIVTGLGEIGLTVGLKISGSKSGTKIWIDAGAVMDGAEVIKAIQQKLSVPKAGLFGGFRISF
jgi:hypothetical protein